MQTSCRGKAIALLVICVLAPGCSDSSKKDSTTTTQRETTTSSTTTATSTPTTDSTPTTTATGEQPEAAIWPFASTSTRYQDPAEAARGFAVDYLGFVSPLLDEFQAGDSRSGEVPLRATPQGPVTTVMVRQFGSDDSWWVIGAATANIQIESPSALAVVSSPLAVSGQSTAFEATINLEVREDGRMDPLATGFTQGGSMGEMGPFSTSLDLNEGGASAGAVIVKTLSAKDGSIAEASVVRVRFA